MRVLIVAKTRRGAGACVGGITQDGRSVRLVAADADRNEHAGLEYSVGEVWAIEANPDPNVIPPHVENMIVHRAERSKRVGNIEEIIHRFMPPVEGGPEHLFDGWLQATPAGGLYIAEGTGLPSCSTMFWTPDHPLQRDVDGKRIRYRYPTPDGGRTLTFVGFQEPVEVIPAGTLLRVSLAHWWRPRDQPEEELRCHVQLSGWFLRQKNCSPSVASTAMVAPKPVVSRATSEAAGAAATPCGLNHARQILKQTFGFKEFLPLQADIITRVLDRGDTLVVLPTGGGKSLCYQLPALLLDGLTVVVSPLIALMQDQVSQLHQIAVQAAFLNSTLALNEYTSITKRVRSGEVPLLYVAPETLLRPETLVLLEQSRFACFAVDEAHCISEWGHDFRPEYRQLQQVRRRFPQAVCVALTATATSRVREDIRRLLGIEAAGEFVASFNRPNLFLAVRPRRDGLGQTLAFLEKHRGQSGIIYCSVRKQVDRLAAELTARGWSALPYHAGLDARTRRRNQDAFIRDDATIMVATVAFGLGINKSNVRFVLHYNLPRDIESYYQEIGRSGRDSLPAECLLLHSRADAVTIRRFIDEGAESERAGRQARLDAMIRYAETAGCRRVPLLAYFGETLSTERGQPGPPAPTGPVAPADKAVRPPAGGAKGHCGQCDNCRAGEHPVQTVDVTEAARKFLECVQRTGECFGPSHIIDVLRGSRSERVLARRHERLGVYGAGQEFTKDEWRELVHQFIEQGLVQQDLEYGGLRLGAKARQVLGGEKVLVRRQPAPAQAAVHESAPTEHDPELFEHLRRKRRELADLAGVPPYFIFSDRTLVEMATHLPRTREQLLAINGVGEVKLANYGDTFLHLIDDYCTSHGRSESPTGGQDTAGETAWITVKRRFEEVGEAFAAGQSISELAERFGVKQGTILQNLQRWHDAGHPLDANRLLQCSRLPPQERERALAQFRRLGHRQLSPVYDALGGQVAYDELHLLRLYLMCQTQETLQEKPKAAVGASAGSTGARLT